MANMISGVISITISAVILASVFISSIKNTNQTFSQWNGTAWVDTGRWTTSEIAMWSLLTLIGIVGLLYGVLNVFGLA